MINKNTGNSRKGFTLVEVMIYSVLIGVILAGIYGTLIFSMRYFNTISTVSAMQDSVLIALSRIEMDISETRADSVKIEKEPINGIMFPVLKNSDGKYSFNSKGEVEWQGWICYYLEKDGTGTYNLAMKRKGITSVAVEPGTPPYTTVQGFVQDSTISRQIIARNVKDINIERIIDPDTGALTRNFKIEIAVDGSENNAKEYNIKAQTEIMLRN
jgi:prepilin-type N-terminal cleavage/methylation domain-containing protein